MRLSRWKLHIKFFKLTFSVDKLKSPRNTKFSYMILKKFKARFNSLVNERSFCEEGLIWPNSSHLLFDTLNSNKIIKLFQNFNNWWFYQVDFHLRRVKAQLRFFFLSLRYILQPSAKNWESGNESSILVWDSRSISVLLKTVCWRFENLFLREFIMRWPMIRFFGYIRRCLLNPIRSLFSVSEDSERKDSFELLLLRPICS